MSERKDYNALSKKQKVRRLNKVYINSLHNLLSRHSSSVAVLNQGSSYSDYESLSSINTISNDVFDSAAIPESQYNFESVRDELDAQNFQVGDVTGTMTNDNGIEFQSLDSLENNSVGGNNSEQSNDLCNNSPSAGNKPFNLKDFLREWAISFSVRDQAVTKLLHGLKYSGHNDLPLDARTLKQTPRANTFLSMGSGSYAHYGLQRGLLDQLKCFDQDKIPNNIAMILNIDGLPLSQSSSSQVWPILFRIANYSHGPCDPFVAGIYHGDGKPPNVNEFLEPTILEYIELSDEGFEYNNRLYKVFIKLFAADSVARNYVMCFPPHNSRCGKCDQVGKTVQHRRVFLDNDFTLRSDENFRKDVPPQYENLLSPLEGIISLTKQVPLDPMHLLDEGVGKKHIKLLLNFYGNGADAKRRLQSLNDHYTAFKVWVPSDFVRKTRTLQYIDRFKATELRLAILYTMPVLFQNRIPHNLMFHFNLLNCALRILYDPNECIRNNPLAKELLTVYVNYMKIYFGEIQIIYNVHNLLHLADDVLRFGPLDSFSVINFENYLQTIKKLVRKGSYPLAQIMNRLNEKSQLRNATGQQSISPGHFVLRKSIITQIPNGYSRPHQKIEFHNFVLSIKKPDNCCYLEDDTIVVIKHICHLNELPVILGFKYENLSSIENYPIDSTLLGICKTNSLSPNLQAWPINNIKKKAFRIFSGTFYYIFPLIHSIS